MNIAVFVSGNGTNLQALIAAEERDELSSGKIVLVVCDKPEAEAIKRAEKAGIKTFVHDGSKVSSREEYDKEVVEELKKENIELIVLAGFMRIISDLLIEEYYGRIINIHPALLPSFKGVHGVKDAFDYGVKVTGVTVHFVTKELDAGPVILQSQVLIEDDDSVDTLEEKIHGEEHKIYPLAVRLFVEGKLEIVGNKVKMLNK